MARGNSDLARDGRRTGDNLSSPRQLARIAGVFYLPVGIFGGFAEGFVDPKLRVAGNAAATAANVAANAELVRMGVVAHLVDGVFFALTAMALYLLFETRGTGLRGIGSAVVAPATRS